MRRSLFPAILLASSLAILLVGCGGDKTPKAALDSADQAFRTDKDYAKAMQLYRSVLDWQGEPPPTDTERFTASLQLVRCQVFSKDFDNAVMSLEEMRKIHKDAVTHKDYCAIIRDLSSHKAIDQAIEVVRLGALAFPDKKQEFEGSVEELQKMGLSDDQMEKLKKIGYL